MSEYKTKPGFVRVFIPAKNKTTRIREQHARNRNFLERHGLVIMADPQLPPVIEAAQPKPVQVTKAQPTKVKHGN